MNSDNRQQSHYYADYFLENMTMLSNQPLPSLAGTFKSDGHALQHMAAKYVRQPGPMEVKLPEW